MDDQVPTQNGVGVINVESDEKKGVCDDIPPFVCHSILHEEISMEEALLKRLRETISKRLEWALKLQSLITSEPEKGVKLEESDSVVDERDFSEAAKRAYDAISSNCSILFPATDTARPPNLITHPDSIANQLSIARLNAPPPPTATPAPNNLPLLPRTRTTTRVPPAQSPQYLYIVDTLSTPPLLYKLTCAEPSCRRSDFPRLQGLLNHCRIKHGQEYGSHDECIQACAVLVEEEEEREKVIREGLEIKGMSASLKRLFEIAVGRGVGVVARSEEMDLPNSGEQDWISAGLEAVPMDVDSGALQSESSSPSTLLSQTLGIHSDSPALAPFLRVTQRKRCINVYDDPNAVIDINDGVMDLTEPPPKIYQPWRKAYHQRSLLDSSAGSDDIIALSSELCIQELSGDDKTQETINERTATTPSTSTRSRFHITARLGISDWSLRISDIPNTGPTHRWMVVVQAPTYSIHASTFVSSVTLLPIENPPHSFVQSPTVTMCSPSVVSSPPFIFTGTSNTPFSARLAIEFVGSGPVKKRTEVEQWVDLEAGKTERPSVGDEQLIDVELDRNTPLLPRRGDEDFFARSMGIGTSGLDADVGSVGTPPTSAGAPMDTSQSEWAADFYASALGISKRAVLATRAAAEDGADAQASGTGRSQADGSAGKAGRKGDGKKRNKESEPAHISHLRALLPRFPMTLKDAVIKSRPTAQSQLPYFLPMSPAHFNAMVSGRQKAIEWGRARALYEAYCALASCPKPSMSTPNEAETTTVTPPKAATESASNSPMPISTSETPVASSTSTDGLPGLPNTTSPEQPPTQSQSQTLSLNDIYRWLETEGHFIRTPKTKVPANVKVGDKFGKLKIKVKFKGTSTTHDVLGTEPGTSNSGSTPGAKGPESDTSPSNHRVVDVYGGQYDYCPLCGVNLRAAGAGVAPSSVPSSGEVGNSTMRPGSSKAKTAILQKTDYFVKIRPAGQDLVNTSSRISHVCPMRPSHSSSASTQSSDLFIPTQKAPLLDIAAIRRRCSSKRHRDMVRAGASVLQWPSAVRDSKDDTSVSTLLSHNQSNVLKSESSDVQVKHQGRPTSLLPVTLDHDGNGEKDEPKSGHTVVHETIKAPATGTEECSDAQHKRVQNPSAGSYSALVAYTDPTLISAIQRVVRRLSKVHGNSHEGPFDNRMQSQPPPSLSYAPDSIVLPNGGKPGPVPESSSSLGEVESVHDIAPYALLGQLVRIYTKRLVTDGLNVLNTSGRYTVGVFPQPQERVTESRSALLQGQSQGPQGRSRVALIPNSTKVSSLSTLSPPGRLLTPTHIFRGLEERARRTEGLDSIILSIARLGVWVDEEEETVSSKT